MLLKRYDMDFDRKWSYPEFVDAILPKNRDYAAIARGHVPFNTTGRYGRMTLFTAETSFLFKKLLRGWIDCEVNSERVRRRIQDISVYDAFSALDTYHKGYLTEIEVRLSYPLVPRYVGDASVLRDERRPEVVGGPL